MRPRDWKVVRRYLTGDHAQRDADDNHDYFDIYKQAGELMELSGMKMLPEQEVQAGGVHLWQIKRQASSSSNGYAICEFSCPDASHVQSSGWIAHCKGYVIYAA